MEKQKHCFFYRKQNLLAEPDFDKQLDVYENGEKMSGLQTKTDMELVQESIQGSQEAFGELVRRYKNLVYSVVMRMVNNPEDANDLAQEVFLKIYRNLDKYSSTYQFSTWVIRIATNTVIDFHRKKRLDAVSMEDMVVEVAGGERPEEKLSQKENRRQLENAIAALPQMYRIPIVLYHLEEMSYQEIATALQIPLSKVKNRIFRGRKLLKEYLLQGKEGEKVDL